MAVFGMSFSLGIGDIIYIHNIMENEKHKFDLIYLSPMWPLIDIWRNGTQEYKVFADKLIKTLFTDPKYIIAYSTDLPHISSWSLVNNSGMKITKPNLDVLCDKQIEINEPFIVITTKVREFHISFFNDVREQFLQTLSALSNKYKIIVIGEREIEMNTEYTTRGAHDVYCIYDAIKNSGIDFTDMTVPKLGLTIPDLEKIKYDCSLMKKANAVITFGIGGNFVLAAGCAQKLVSYCHDTYSFIFKQYTGVPEYYITPDKNIFLKALGEV
jgi:hypothetical protein